MSKKFLGVLTVLVATLVIAAPAAKAAYVGADANTLQLKQSVGEDAFLAGSTVTVSAPVAGELFAAGNTVNISKKSARSTFAVGSTVTAEDGSGYNAYLAGTDVTLGGVFEHDVYVAGNTVTLRSDTVIKGQLHAAGSTVTLAGKINGDVYLAAAKLTSGAELGGSLKVSSADSIDFTGGSIAGDFLYTSVNDATNTSKVKIAGRSQHTQQQAQSNTASTTGAGVVGYLLSLLILGSLIILVAGRTKLEVVEEELTTRWGTSFARGFLVLILGPVLGIILLSTLYGWKAAFLIGFAWAVLLLLATASGVLVVGSWILTYMQKGRPTTVWSSLLVGALVIALLVYLPANLGGLVWVAFFFGAVLPSLGAWVTWWHEKV